MTHVFAEDDGFVAGRERRRVRAQNCDLPADFAYVRRRVAGRTRRKKRVIFHNRFRLTRERDPRPFRVRRTMRTGACSRCLICRPNTCSGRHTSSQSIARRHSRSCLSPRSAPTPEPRPLPLITAQVSLSAYRDGSWGAGLRVEAGRRRFPERFQSVSQNGESLVPHDKQPCASVVQKRPEE